MIGNSTGTLFRVSAFGESHGPALGVIVDGCPAGLELNLEEITAELERRRPGQSRLVSPRKESDSFELLSGLFEGKTTGMPLAFVVYNHDVKSKDYTALRDLFRPGHGDFTYFAKYRHRDYRGGGRSSARETVSRVIAGAVAKQLLAKKGIYCRGGLVQLGSVRARARDWDFVEQNELRATDPEVVQSMTELLDSARKERDSLGGVVEVVAFGVMPGLGEPVFGKLDAALGAAMFSIPAVKGVEFGLGFELSSKRGSEANDEMAPEGFLSNNHGGILGGISSGAPIVVRLAIKPTSSIPREQQTVTTEFSKTTVSTLGRHDPCVAIRSVAVAEAMLAITLIDFLLQDAATREIRKDFSPLEPFCYGLSETHK